MQNCLISPHGGSLVDACFDHKIFPNLKDQSSSLYNLTLKDRQRYDLELILNGAFSPLQGFMCSEDYLSVLEYNTLNNGCIWPIPILLDVEENKAKALSVGDFIALRNDEGYLLAIMEIEDKWLYDKKLEAQKIYGSMDKTHPGVRYLFEQGGSFCLGGKLQGVSIPKHFDFQHL